MGQGFSFKDRPVVTKLEDVANLMERFDKYEKRFKKSEETIAKLTGDMQGLKMQIGRMTKKGKKDISKKVNTNKTIVISEDLKGGEKVGNKEL